jgi:histidinol-phosphatase (PHP family)
MLPPDNHVHSQWSWDAVAGSMEASCERAVALGLPSIAFTEHLDLSRWVFSQEALARMRIEVAQADDRVRRRAERVERQVGPDGRFNPPPLDVEGYLACLEWCRERYPALRILSGVELGEPHWFAEQCSAVLAALAPDRVLGSLHTLVIGGEPWIIDQLWGAHAPGGITPDSLVRAYLAETLRMVESSGLFAVLAHIDYPVRRWPATAGPYDPTTFEDEYRAVLRALARSGRVLEVNSRVPLHPLIVRWWREEGGAAVSFGSDAHEPSLVARDFAHTAAMVETEGFGPARTPHDFWVRSSVP